MKQRIQLDGNSLTLRDVWLVAHGDGEVELAPSARGIVAQRRHFVDEIVRRGDVVYGVTTGFGKLSDVAIPPDRLAELQVNLVRSHAAGVGDLLPEREVRAMMLLRANVIAKGYSGARADARRAAAGDAQRRALSAGPGAGKRRRERRSRAARASRALAHRRRRAASRRRRRAAPPTMLDGAALAPVTLAAEGRAHAHQRHAGAHGDRRARARRRASPLAHGARRRRDVARGAAWARRRVRSRAFRTRAASSARRRRPRSCASCSPTARFASRIARTIRACRTRTRCAACRRCTVRCSTRSTSPTGVVSRELNAATDNPLVFEDGDAAERRQLPRAVGGDGARLHGDRADESRDDLRAPHRSARASRSQSGAAAVPHAATPASTPAS